VKITIEPTDVLTQVNGVMTRLWRGHMAGRGRCDVYVAAVASDVAQVQFALAAVLIQTAPPPEAVVPLHDLSPAPQEAKGGEPC
jgi:hypothetical protein